ncbi:hypothetical protein V2G26_011753 [Clonostachys chloroleuca]
MAGPRSGPSERVVPLMCFHHVIARLEYHPPIRNLPANQRTTWKHLWNNPNTLLTDWKNTAGNPGIYNSRLLGSKYPTADMLGRQRLSLRQSLTRHLASHPASSRRRGKQNIARVPRHAAAIVWAKPDSRNIYMVRSWGETNLNPK